MSSEQKHIDYGQVVKYLSNEADAKERQRLETWIAANAGNRAEFEKIRVIWQKTGTYREAAPVEVDPLLAWNRLKRRIDDAGAAPLELEKETSRTKGLFYYIPRIAAAAALAIVVIYLFQLDRKQEVISLQAEEAIVKDTLPDQTAVALNAVTTLTFTETPTERRAGLSGEAFFDVKPDSAKPFVIDAGEALVKVVGTSFNLQAYPENDTIVLAMQTGHAWLIGKAAGDSLLVAAGGKAILSKATGRIGTLDTDPANDAFWLTRTLIFKRTDLLQVFKMLERNYQVNISVANPGILNCRLSARYSDATVENILEQIAAVFNLQISAAGREFQVTGEGCN